MKKFVPEILKQVNDAKTKAEKSTSIRGEQY